MKNRRYPKTNRDKISVNRLLTLTVVLGVMMLILTGCGMIGSADTPKETEFLSGTKGISIEFLDGAPPEKAYIGNDFSVGVRIKNLGAYDILGQGTVDIVVPDESAFKFTEGKTKQFVTRGRSIYVDEGEETMMFFPVKALCFPGYDGTQSSVKKNYTRPIKAMACYNYQTNAKADVCVDTQKYLREESQEAPCVMKEITLSGGQGGPVGVTKITPSIIPLSSDVVKYQLKIVIEKLGDDTMRIFHPQAPNRCEDVQWENMVPVVVQMGKEVMNCEPIQPKMKKGGVEVMCTKEVDTTMGTFTTAVNINMDYMIYQGVLHEINIAAPYDTEVDCEALST